MSNNKQSSSVDFFWDQLPEILPFTVDTETAVKLWEAFEQAKSMHKEETINFALCYTFGQYNVPEKIRMNIEKYYNETYESNT